MNVTIVIDGNDMSSDLLEIKQSLGRIETKMAAIDDQVAELTTVVEGFEATTTTMGQSILDEIARLTAANPALAGNLDRLKTVGNNLIALNAQVVAAGAPTV